MKYKAAFIDRDGVINEDYGYVSSWERFRFKRNVKKGLLILQNLGYRIIIVTNQSGIGRGYYSIDDYQNLTNRYISDLRKCEVKIDRVYFCPHYNSNEKSKKFSCICRKPKPGLILKAIKELDLNPKVSILIGDKISDIQAGFNGGIAKRYLISKKEVSNQLINGCFNSLFDCANYIKSNPQLFK